jgi:hypothetical protein
MKCIVVQSHTVGGMLFICLHANLGLTVAK